MARQALNVFRMRLLGAEVRPALTGSRTLKDAVNEAMRDWVATVEDSHYCLGSVMGPAPVPVDGARVPPGHRRRGAGAVPGAARRVRDPDVVVACVGGGSNAAGIFSGFAELADVELVGVEPAGGAAVGHGVPGRRARDAELPHAGRRRAGAGGRVDLGRASTTPASAPSTPTWPTSAGPATSRSTDAEVLDAFELLAGTEGIIPALESAHALAWVARAARGRRARRQGRARQPVGPGRQGRRPGRRPPRRPVPWRDGDPSGCRSRRRCGRPATPAASCSCPTSPAAWTTLARRRCGPWPTPAPTPSRSASRSPTR